MIKLKEALGIMKGLSDELAVWNEVVNHLRKFVDDDVNYADKGICTGEGVTVAQDVVESVIRGVMKDKINPLEDRIQGLNDTELEVKDAAKVEQKPEKKAEKKGNGNAKAAPAAKKRTARRAVRRRKPAAKQEDG